VNGRNETNKKAAKKKAKIASLSLSRLDSKRHSDVQKSHIFRTYVTLLFIIRTRVGRSERSDLRPTVIYYSEALMA